MMIHILHNDSGHFHQCSLRPTLLATPSEDHDHFEAMSIPYSSPRRVRRMKDKDIRYASGMVTTFASVLVSNATEMKKLQRNPNQYMHVHFLSSTKNPHDRSEEAMRSSFRVQTQPGNLGVKHFS